MGEVLAGEIAGISRLVPAKARVGLIIPAVNSLTEPQFHHFAPADLGIHVARLRMSGGWKKPFAQLGRDIVEAASLLADVKPDLIVLHCTGTAMQEGVDEEARIVRLIEDETGIAALSTGAAILAALSTLRLDRLVLISPYVQATNDHEIAYLRQAGIDVAHDVALGLVGGVAYAQVTPERWVALALANDRPDCAGFLLSCTNTTQIEAIAEIERRSGKQVVNSNQAVLWACLARLRGRVSAAPLSDRLGRLMREGLS